MQAPKSALSTVSGQSGQPQCLANVRKLKLKEGEVQVEPSLTGVLDDLLHAAAFKMLRGLCGEPLLLGLFKALHRKRTIHQSWCLQVKHEAMYKSHLKIGFDL